MSWSISWFFWFKSITQNSSVLRSAERWGQKYFISIVPRLFDWSNFLRISYDAFFCHTCHAVSWQHSSRNGCGLRQFLWNFIKSFMEKSKLRFCELLSTLSKFYWAEFCRRFGTMFPLPWNRQYDDLDLESRKDGPFERELVSWSVIFRKGFCTSTFWLKVEVKTSWVLFTFLLGSFYKIGPSFMTRFSIGTFCQFFYCTLQSTRVWLYLSCLKIKKDWCWCICIFGILNFRLGSSARNNFRRNWFKSSGYSYVAASATRKFFRSFSWSGPFRSDPFHSIPFQSIRQIPQKSQNGCMPKWTSSWFPNQWNNFTLWFISKVYSF